MKYYTGDYVELGLELEHAELVSHQGRCDDDVLYVSNLPYVKEQLKDLTPNAIKKELWEYGAWDDDELNDEEENRLRLIWVFGGNIKEEHFQAKLIETGKEQPT